MRIILDETDFQKLSPEARDEITKLLRSRTAPAPKAAAPMPVEETARLLSLPLARQLLRAPLSDKTIAYLKVFAASEGVAALDRLLEATGYRRFSDLKGIHTGLLKRLRRLTGDPGACLYQTPSHWQRSRGDPGEAVFRMPRESALALREVLEEEGM